MSSRGTKAGDASILRPGLKAMLLAGSALCGLALAGGLAHAQSPLAASAAAGVPSGAQLFLEADTVTYDSQASVVTAGGGVQIDYGTYKLVARNVVYNQKTRRLIASGDVQLQQPDGNTIYADTIDITDDFRDGFVKALRIETPENTRLAASAAIRKNGDVTSFENGVYTACQACKEHPERAPLWQVKARKIVWDQTAKEIRYYGARFEFFGAPLAYLPYFQSPDPTVKRKSGLLPPEFRSSSELGYGLRVPYFFAIADDKDVTVAGTYYTKQGFLAEAEYRQAFENGFFTLQTAGIIQQNPDEFAHDNTATYLSPDFANTNRGMIGTTARFALNEQWTFGWSLLLQTDDNFSKTYKIENFGNTLETSEVYLTGLGDQSYFDLRAQKFDYQSIYPVLSQQQPFVAPVFDYERIEQETTFGGEVKLDMNVTSLSRDTEQFSQLCATSLVLVNKIQSCSTPANGFQYNPNLTRYNGLDGNYTRGSANLAWSDTYTLPSGLVISPTAGLRGDLYTADMQSNGFANPYYVNGVANSFVTQGAIDVNGSGARGMATAAVEVRYPYLIETAHTSQVIEPIAQLIARPDETKIGVLPNEDAQTLVFNTTNLFALDKFSGYDRIEGGTRANLGVRYNATIDSGYSLDAVVGQSYRLAGINSFAQTGLSLVGYDSGLETNRSDYVGSVALGTPVGLTFGTQGRFDETSLALRRSDIYTAYSFSRGSAQVTYTNIAAQPIYGSLDDRSQVTTSASLNFAPNWNAFGAVGYDIKNSVVVDKSFGVKYQDECFSLLVSYTDTVDRYSQEANSSTVMFQVGLRTISDFKQSIDVGG